MTPYRTSPSGECDVCKAAFPLEALDATENGYLCQRCREQPFVEATLPRCGLCERVIEVADPNVARLCAGCRAPLASSSTGSELGFPIRTYDSFSRFWILGGYLIPVGIALACLAFSSLAGLLLAAPFLWLAEKRRRACPDQIAVFERGLVIGKAGRFFPWREVEAVQLVWHRGLIGWTEELRIRLRGAPDLRIHSLLAGDTAYQLARLHPSL